MKFIYKQLIQTLFLFFFIISFSQTNKIDSLRGDFTYLLQYRPNKVNKDYVIKELFSLQISDNKAFFSSVNKLKIDSAFSSQFKKNSNTINLDFRNLPKSQSNYLIVQTIDSSNFYESIGMTLLMYTNPVINNWKLTNETKVVNSINCKKAELHYKGRDWIAWYSDEIPFPFGPFKFSGLPGLIIKITDKTGDYDFELIKSVPSNNLRGKIVFINESRYKNPKIVTKKQLSEAWKNFRNNAKYEFEKMGTTFSQDTRDRNIINESEKIGYNPLELEE